MSPERLLFNLTFGLAVLAWALYTVAWHFSAPKRRVYWIFGSAICTVLTAAAAIALFLRMLLW